MKIFIYFSDDIHILNLCFALLLNSFFFVIAYKGNNIFAADIWESMMFLKEVSSVHQGFIYLIQNTVKTAQLWKINAI